MTPRSRSGKAWLLAFAIAILGAEPVWAQDRPRSVPDQSQEIVRNPDSQLRDIRVQVAATASAVIGAPMPGRLSEFPLRDGDRFEKGQTLARFVCSERDGALAHARARLTEKRRTLANKQQLRSLGNSTGLEYDIAVAEVSEAEAEVTINQAMVENCTISAPFPGRVASISVHRFQYVAQGTPMLDILSDGNLELEMIVPSRWVSWLKPGTAFDATIDETGKTYKAELNRVSGRVDPVSRSIKMYSHVVSPDGDLLPGMSGRALLAAPPSGR